jgi:hypothetical protein
LVGTTSEQHQRLFDHPFRRLFDQGNENGWLDRLSLPVHARA